MQRPRNVAPALELFPARTPTLPPATHTNSYALGTRALLLVEPATPFPEEQREWLAWARGLASKGRRLAGIFLTHHHPDHIGGARFFAEALGVPLWAHAETAARLPDLPIGRHLSDGEEIRLEGPELQRWRVLHTPGHAPGHLCLFEEGRRHVIVGDMVASEGTIVVAPGDGDMRVYLEQLERLRRLDAACALPAHGDPIAEPSLHFAAYIRHRLMREEKVLAALRAAGEEGAPPHDLLPDVYADTPRAAWGLAALSLAAHLDKLVEEGRARSDGERFAVPAPG